MTKLEEKLEELGYRVSMTQTINEVVIKTWLKEIDATNFHWVQTINGKIMNSMSDKPNELQNDLEVLKEYENVKGDN
jgi:hypothetical protein